MSIPMEIKKVQYIIHIIHTISPWHTAVWFPKKSIFAEQNSAVVFEF